MKAFILAGGFATRLWPLTEKRAKPLLPLAGKPILSRLTEKIPNGIGVTVSTNAVFAADFAAWKSKTLPLSNSPPKSEIRILIEDAGNEDEKLGALGAIRKWCIENKIDDDILLLAGDNYIGFSIAEFIANYDGNPLIATYDTKNKEQAGKFGVVTSDNGRVTSFREKPANPKSTLVSTGCTIIPKNCLPTLISYAEKHADNIGGIFEHFLAKGVEIKCAVFEDQWFDIGSFQDYLDATKAIVGENTIMEHNVTARENTYKGSIVIGGKSRITNSGLHNVVIFENCVVENCVLENCILDNDCELRGIDLNGKMIRTGTKLKAKA